MARVTRKEWYRRVNASWPDKVPPLTAIEAERAARRLYRFVTGSTFRGRVVITSGNRHTSVRLGVITVNPSRGWHDLVHSMSHWLERYAGTHGHNAAHARLEMRMIKQVVWRGWLDGKLKDTPRAVVAIVEPSNPVDKRAAERAVKIARTVAAIARWEAKQRRAENALKKLHRRRRALERAQLAIVA